MAKPKISGSLIAAETSTNHTASMDYFLQQLVNGLSLGAIYALIAIGYTMVYGIIGMINFAHGEIYMVGAFIALVGFLIMGVLGITYVPLAIALVLLMTMGITAIYGWTVERIAYRPLRGSSRLAPLISAIGVSIVLQNYVQLAQGARVKTMQPIVTGSITLDTGGAMHVTVSVLQLLIVVLTLALMVGFTWLIRNTSLGRSQRATEQDRTMAALLGVNVDRTISTTFVIGAAIAAVASVMVTLYYGVVDFYIGFLAGIKAFTAAVLGGIGSLPGAMLGGFLIGLIEAFWSGYFSIAYKDVAVFAVLVLVLVFRPSGLLGRPEEEKV
jgi:branched-chain amino acid transport system permease protein